MDDSQSLSEAVCDVLSGEMQFDNEYIVNYAKEHYAQEEITKHILGIFDEVAKTKKKIREYDR